MLVQTKQRLKEVLGSTSGNDVLTEFVKLDALAGSSVATTEAVHTVFAGPTTGSPAVPAFRVLAASDMPATMGAVAHTGAVSIAGAFTTTSTLGFYSAAAIAQPTAGGVTTGFTAVNTSTVVASASTFTGGTGSSAYTIGDIVYALKKLGLIAT